MGEKKGEDLYHNFSRKDIQGLCKKYGLPANKSNFEMATSLILYLEKKNLNSRTMWEATRSDPCASGTSELRIGAGMILSGDQSKDRRGTASHSGSGNNRDNNQDVQQNDSQNCKGIVTSDKASENLGNLTELHRDSNNGSGPPEKAFSSVLSSPLPARSADFQFDVRSEDGIQLCVDLNSNLSDWIESMKNGVHICQCHDVHWHSSQGFQKDLDRLGSRQMKSPSVVDSDEERNNGKFEDGCSPTSMGTGIEGQAGEPDTGEGSLCFPQPKSCNSTVHSQENMADKQSILPSSVESDAAKEVSGAKSCEREDKTIAAVSAVSILTQSRTCNVSGKSCDLKHSGMSENQVLNAGNDIYENLPLNGFLNPALKYMVPPGSASEELQASPCTSSGRDVGPSPSRAGTCTDLVNRLLYTEGERSGLPQSLQFHGNLHQLQSVEVAGASRYVTCSSKSGLIEDDHRGGAVSSKSNGQVVEAQTHLATCCRESMSVSPYNKYGSLGVVHLSNNIELENGGFLRLPEPCQEAVDVSVVGVQREEIPHSLCGNDVSLDLVVREQNGADKCILTCSTELVAENRKSQPATCVGNVGTSNVGDGQESSGYLVRDLMERSWIDLTNIESNGEPKRKRPFNSVEDQSNFVHSGSWILRTSKQSAGDVHASRRRSSRFSTK